MDKLREAEELVRESIAFHREQARVKRHQGPGAARHTALADALSTLLTGLETARGERDRAQGRAKARLHIIKQALAFAVKRRAICEANAERYAVEKPDDLYWSKSERCAAQEARYIAQEITRHTSEAGERKALAELQAAEARALAVENALKLGAEQAENLARICRQNGDDNDRHFQGIAEGLRSAHQKAQELSSLQLQDQGSLRPAGLRPVEREDASSLDIRPSQECLDAIRRDEEAAAAAALGLRDVLVGGANPAPSPPNTKPEPQVKASAETLALAFVQRLDKMLPPDDGRGELHIPILLYVPEVRRIIERAALQSNTRDTGHE